MRERGVWEDEIEGVLIEFEYEPCEWTSINKQRVGDKLVVAYLSLESYPENPQKYWDGEGELFTKPEWRGGGSITDNASWGWYLGLTGDGELDLDMNEVKERAKELLRKDIFKDLDFINFYLEAFEEVDCDIEEFFDSIDFDYDRIPMWLHFMREAQLETAWGELYAEGKIGAYLAVPVNYCANNHGPGTTSAYVADLDNCNAVWVPGKIEIGNMALDKDMPYFEKLNMAREYAENCLKTYISWCNGDVYGCVVQIHEAETGEIIDSEAVWGFYGGESAEDSLLSEFFEPAVSKCLKEIEHA